jgi:hypothetical protein
LGWLTISVVQAGCRSRGFTGNSSLRFKSLIREGHYEGSGGTWNVSPSLLV